MGSSFSSMPQVYEKKSVFLRLRPPLLSHRSLSREKRMNCLTLPPKESKRGGGGGGMIIALAERSDWLDEEPISSFLSLMGCLFGGSGDPSRRRLRGLDSRVRAGSPSIHHRGRTGRRRDITHKNASINNLSMGGSGRRRRRRRQKQFPPLFCVFWSKKKLSFFFCAKKNRVYDEPFFSLVPLSFSPL